MAAAGGVQSEMRVLQYIGSNERPDTVGIDGEFIYATKSQSSEQYVTKYNHTDGNFEWARRFDLDGISVSRSVTKPAFDDDYMYVGIHRSQSSNLQPCIAVLDKSSGALQRQLQPSYLAGASYYNENSTKDHIFIDGTTLYTTSSYNTTTFGFDDDNKLFSMSTTDWSKNWGSYSYGGIGTNDTFEIGVAKLNGIVFIYGDRAETGSGTQKFSMIEVNSSDGSVGSVGYEITTTGTYGVYSRPAYYDGYYYIVFIQYSPTRQMTVMKFNTSGTISWQKTISHSGANVAANVPSGIHVDSTGVYLGHQYRQVSTWANMVVKFDLSGNFEWARSFSMGGSSQRCEVLGEDPTNENNIVFFEDGYDFFVSYPKDGSITGTYSVDTNSITVTDQDSAVSGAISTGSYALNTSISLPRNLKLPYSWTSYSIYSDNGSYTPATAIKFADGIT